MALTTYEQLRACHVRRWHIVQTTREQTLAEHSFAVAVIAGSLAAKMRYPGLVKFETQLALLRWALYHDLMETRTGDTPTPFKRALEAASSEGVIERAERLIDPEATGAYRSVKGTEIEMIVKLADLVEAIFFLQDNGSGQHAREVLAGLHRSLTAAVDDAARAYPALLVRDAVRQVCADIHITRSEP